MMLAAGRDRILCRAELLVPRNGGCIMRVERCVRCGEIVSGKLVTVTISEGQLSGLMGKNKVYGLCIPCSQGIDKYLVRQE